MEGTSQSLEFFGTYSRVIKGSLKKTTCPQYNGDLSWDLQQSKNYKEDNIRLNIRADLWEVQQLYSGQSRDSNVRLGVICKQQKIDWPIYTTLPEHRHDRRAHQD